MSISNQTDKIFGTGDGSTTVFSFPFKIFASTDLVVYEIDTTQTPNISHTKALTTDYSVSINAVGEGGTITFTVAPPLNWQTLIQRVEPFTQSLVLNTEGNLPALQIGNQLDLMTMLCIQVNEAVSRCPQLPVTFSGTLPLTMPLPQAGLVLGWDPTGSFLVNMVSTTVGTIALPISNGNIAPLIAPNLAKGSSFYGLSTIPTGAGIIPIANIPTGTTVGTVPLLDANGKVAYANLNAFPYVKCSMSVASGTAAGAATLNAWTACPLNTKDNDTASIGTLATNKITLPAGTYKVSAKQTFYGGSNAGYRSLRLYNNTGSAVLLTGMGNYTSANISTVINLNGLITLAGATDIYLQYYTALATSDALGVATSLGPEVYATIEFDKIG